MKVYFATWMDNGFGEILTNKDAKNRLISFFFIKSQKNQTNLLRRYIRTGKTEK